MFESFQQFADKAKSTLYNNQVTQVKNNLKTAINYVNAIPDLSSCLVVNNNVVGNVELSSIKRDINSLYQEINADIRNSQ